MNGKALLVVAVVIAAGALGWVILRPQPVAPPPVVVKLDEAPSPKVEIASAPAATPALPKATPAPAATRTPAATPGPSPTPDLSNPENQPRAFMAKDFRTLGTIPSDWDTTNVMLTADGFRLPPPKPGEEGAVRQGTITMAPELMGFPSNAVSPMWRDQRPDGTDVFVEIQVSPDAEHWGPWHWVEPDEDSMGQMNEFYADGRRNPNYGFTPGGVFAWGDMQWNFIRYRFTLYSETEGSPTLEGLRLYHQDSTMGEGHVAVPGVDVAVGQGQNQEAQQ